jgi:hypothetical protein
MNLTITLIAVLMIVLAIVPFLLINRKKKKAEEQFLQSFLNMAKKNNNDITSYDLWNKSAIGLDKKNHKLFYCKKSAENLLALEIDLSEIQKCQVVNSNRSVVSQTVIDKISLVLVNRDKSKPETMIEFYNNDIDSLNLNGEVQLTEKWHKIINADLAEIKKK